MKLTNLSLATKIKLAFLVVPVALIIVITVYSGFNLISQQNELKRSTATQVSESVIEKVDRNFYERFGDVQAYAFNRLAVETALTDSISGQAQTFINTMTAYYVLYDLMMIVGKDGKVIATNTTDKNGYKLQTEFLTGKDFSSSEWFKICTSPKGPEGGAWYSDFEANPFVGQIHGSKGWGMAYAAPIRDDLGNAIGVWYNFASWKEVTQGIRQEALQALKKSEPGAEIFLLDDKSRIIDASDENLVLKSKLEASALQQENFTLISEGNTLQGKDFTHGHAASAGAYTYKGKNWSCVTIIPKAAISLANFFTTELLLIDFLFLGIAFLVATTISGNLVRQIYHLRDIINKLSTGDLSNFEGGQAGKDELAQMALSVEVLAKGLQQTSTFAEEVGKGNFEASFTPLSEKDTLGNSLIKMSNNLKLAAEEDKRRNWSTEGLARFSEIMRNTNDLTLLSEALVSNLVKYLKASHGSLFIVNNTQPQAIQLDLAACYAYDRKKFISKSILPGEGLLGEAYLEKASIYKTKLPKNYIKIASGMGDGDPACLLIVPLKINEKVEGLIEIASFTVLEPYQIIFVEKLAENIAASIATVKINQVTRKLLEESQQQAEQMRAQEEEMRQNMEELIATQEEMHRKENDYLQMIERYKQKTEAEE
ncbi:GAF domain-containing protein [Rhodocytophaga rosea]|uniref:histidine kinase n=1 Tax=Rhodocytophaga rosea TaxID=2704465 RepID=A0A6C0GKB4_9BACT|nr:GAF domain-containing protein [Rhodocytophaga rosea]QHT68399.1 GAF domain-containing protein [Rhodocytophaga rosea]